MIACCATKQQDHSINKMFLALWTVEPAFIRYTCVHLCMLLAFYCCYSLTKLPCFDIWLVFIHSLCHMGLWHLVFYSQESPFNWFVVFRKTPFTTQITVHFTYQRMLNLMGFSKCVFFNWICSRKNWRFYFEWRFLLFSQLSV